MRLIQLVATMAVVASVALTAALGQSVDLPTGPPEITYEEFMRLGREARMEKFRELSANGKALIKRTHAEHWLADNRSRLSDAQLAAVEKGISFVRADIYRHPNNPEIRKQEELVKQNLTCVLGRENARQAFVVDPPPSPPPATWRSAIDAWLSWFSDCVVR